jgi:hypothetical protein
MAPLHTRISFLISLWSPFERDTPYRLKKYFFAKFVNLIYMHKQRMKIPQEAEALAQSVSSIIPFNYSRSGGYPDGIRPVQGPQGAAV